MTRKLAYLALLILWLAPLGAASFAQQTPAGNRAEVGNDEVDWSERSLQRTWWNNTAHYAELKLSTEVRSQMDQLARDHLAKAEPVDQRQHRMAMAAALASGDWDKATAEADLLAEAVAKPVRHQIELKIAIFKLLTPEQRSKLHEISPNLGGKIWIRHQAQPRSPVRNPRAKPDN